MGLIEFANQGVLFLDEIGDMPLSLQAKMLRVLQNQEIQRVGSPIPRKVDVRVVAATHRDLRAMVRDRLFREDLFYRLSMVEIRLPSLFDRKEDLPLLQRYFLERFSRCITSRSVGSLAGPRRCCLPAPGRATSANSRMPLGTRA